MLDARAKCKEYGTPTYTHSFINVIFENLCMTWKTKVCRFCGEKASKSKTGFCRACRIFFFNVKRWHEVDFFAF